MHRISIATVIFLVLLRLAIGWHFLFEGLHKLESVYVGETVSNRPFSSTGYFREATGPLGDPVRVALGDPDTEALARLTVQRTPAGEEPSRATPHLRTPPALAHDWEGYLARFEKHYELNDAQREEARGRLVQAEDTVVLWLEQKVPDKYTPEQKRSYPTGDVLRRIPPAERVQLYRDKLAEMRDMLGRKMWLFGRDVEKARVRQAKTEVAQMRTALVRDLDKHTQALTRTLDLVVAEPVLTPLEYLDNGLVRGNDLLRAAKKDDKSHKALQTVVNGLLALADSTRDLPPVQPENVGPEGVAPLDAGALRKRLQERAAGLEISATELKGTAESDDLKKYAAEVEAFAKSLAGGAAELPQVGPLPITVQRNRLVYWLDWGTMIGLSVVGACLLLGLLTRINCWLAAGFLLMTYLAMPAFPWLPAPPQNEGNYLFVNKNVVEMLALCALGTLPTGRWFGLDAVLGWLGATLWGKRS
jgi:uncharacterized membrane protein YphA (DoxX/SURF4 family)